MRFDYLLRSPCCGCFPTSTTKRQIPQLDELLQRVQRPRPLRQSAVDRLENHRQSCFGFPFAHLRTAAQNLGPPTAFFPINSNPHAMTPVLPGLQAAFLKTLSTHLSASFLRQRLGLLARSRCYHSLVPARHLVKPLVRPLAPDHNPPPDPRIS